MYQQSKYSNLIYLYTKFNANFCHFQLKFCLYLFLYLQVVRVNGGHCRAVSLSKIKHQEKLVPFEIVIKEYTAVDFLGFYGLESKSESSLQKTTFDNIHAVQGSIRKLQFLIDNFCQANMYSI